TKNILSIIQLIHYSCRVSKRYLVIGFPKSKVKLILTYNSERTNRCTYRRCSIMRILENNVRLNIISKYLRLRQRCDQINKVFVLTCLTKFQSFRYNGINKSKCVSILDHIV